jgi:hypothetical protein
MSTNSDKRNESKRCQATYQLKTNLRNGGRIAGIGISYDDYSEESYRPNYDPGKIQVNTIRRTPEELVRLNGPVTIYNIKDLSEDEKRIKGLPVKGED